LTTWLNKKFISDMEFECQYLPFTEKAIIPPGSGDIGRFLTWGLPAAGTVITDGTSENDVTFTGKGTDITIREWGQSIKTNEIMMYAAVKGAREKLSKRLRDGAALTIDTMIRAQAAAATTGTAAYSGGPTMQAGASTTAPALISTMNASALIYCKRLLKDSKAHGFRGVAGHPDKNYAAIISEKAEQDMVQEVSTGKVTWSDMIKNVPGVNGQTAWVDGYIGSVYGVSVYTTQNNAQGTATSLCDINVVLADGGIGCMAFEDMEPGILITPVNGAFQNQTWVAWHLNSNAAPIADVAGVRVIRLYTVAV
jgi:N4-gp56 family major capsid protein